ncbi:hypothetical protein BT96DRAFT_1022189 [Gymnopus androsaceus JB14]|uniref:UFSP1/2/DUB catalytic domain-containing protein n=1 Tax=Gymnopus androsaceus JB14 TaxID=1447944 RepID=A0A6A4HB39_9AGAR|nr:hypothetical protein BT96DRAFT_1022189 [Gymnopus androsaceus JB14]
MWDAGWGCGYRNFLMSCAALMDQSYQPMYFPLLDQPIAPGIRNLQVWIEEAWKRGFDEEGHAQLKSLTGTKKWIGTSDLCTAFVSRGIPAELVDFEIKDTSKGLTPLTNWIVRYFDKYNQRNSASTVNAALLGASPVQCAPCMPLILQNDGHSRMVIGYELTILGGVTLLVFDPSKLPSKRLRNAALASFSATSSSSPSVVSRGNKRSSSDSAVDIESTDTSAPRNLANKRLKVKHDKGIITIAILRGLMQMMTRSSLWASIYKMIRMKSSLWVKCDVRKGTRTVPPKVEKIIPVDEPSFNDVLKHFRWENRSFKRKNKYQILYFPLEEPLTESQMRSRKVLTSERI